MIASSRALNYLDAPCLIILIKKSVLCQLSWFNILTLNDERMLLQKRGWKKDLDPIDFLKYEVKVTSLNLPFSYPCMDI
jgi:hypothetical protein